MAQKNNKTNEGMLSKSECVCAFITDENECKNVLDNKDLCNMVPWLWEPTCR